MKLSPVLSLASLAFLGFATAAQSAITFSYSSSQLTIDNSANITFTLNTAAPDGTVYLVFDDLYSSGQSSGFFGGLANSSGTLPLEDPNSGTVNPGQFQFANSNGTIDTKDLHLNFILSASPGSSGSITLYPGSATSDTSPETIPDPNFAGSDIDLFLTDKNGNQISDTVTVAVPEPGSVASVLGLIGLALVGSRRLRRKRA